MDASVGASCSSSASGHVVRCGHVSGLMVRLVQRRGPLPGMGEFHLSRLPVAKRPRSRCRTSLSALAFALSLSCRTSNTIPVRAG